MKICIVADVLGKPNNGTTLACLNLIDHLSSHGHTVNVLCGDDDKKELDGYFAAGAVETDSARRVEIYNDAQRRLADLAVQYSLVTNLRLLALNSEIAGTDEARFIQIYTFSNYDQLYYQ